MYEMFVFGLRDVFGGEWNVFICQRRVLLKLFLNDLIKDYGLFHTIGAYQVRNRSLAWLLAAKRIFGRCERWEINAMFPPNSVDSKSVAVILWLSGFVQHTPNIRFAAQQNRMY